MNEILKISIYSFFAGITIICGGLVAAVMEKYRDKNAKRYITHFSIAFGGGILVAAVAFVLVPEGLHSFQILPVSLLFMGGSGAFFVLDRFIEKKGGLMAQLLAMLMDFIPEVIALGAVFAHDHRTGLLLAFFIGLQNFPESFNAYFDLRKNGLKSSRILLIFIPLSFIGIVGGLAGSFMLSKNPHVIAGLMMFAAGGILYLIFQDIAPLSKIRKRWSPALGATLGFLVGMVGSKLLQ